MEVACILRLTEGVSEDRVNNELFEEACVSRLSRYCSITIDLVTGSMDIMIEGIHNAGSDLSRLKSGSHQSLYKAQFFAQGPD